ncbi:MAG: T9SS type A sorting domain-containing protein, partial [Bacteroidota bacterium]
ATSVAPLSATGAEFAAGGFQSNPERSFFFSKNGIEPQPPGVLFSASPDTACAPATVVLTNNFTGALGYAWFLDGVQFSTQANPAPLQLPDGGAHVIKLDVQTSSTNKINTFTVNSLPEIWNECAFCDNKPDPFLRIKNAAGTVVYTSTWVESYPPVQLPVSFTMQANQSYKFEIWDDDNVGADDLFGTFNIPGNTPGGMFSLIHPEDPDNPLKITFTVTPTIATQSFTQNVVVFQPIATLTGGNVLQANPGNPAPSSYSFQWQLNGQNIPGATGSTYSPTATGSYTVTMLTPFCTAISDPVLFTVAFSASIESTPPLCFGEASGSILVTPLGGTAPFTYAWNPATLSGSNPTNLPAGDYAVTLTDAQGLTTTLQTTLTEPAEIILSAEVTHPSCEGAANGSILLTISGGTGIDPTTISWTPTGTGANPGGLLPGTYSTTVTDANGCSEFVEVELVAEAGIQVAATVTNVTCAGGSDGSISLTIAGGIEPYAFVWTPPIIGNPTGLPAGNYVAIITDVNGCSAEISATITEPLPATASTTSTPHLSDSGTEVLGTATVTTVGGTPPYTYLWSTSPPQTTQTATNLPTGDYSVTVTDGNGCTVVATAHVDFLSAAGEVAEVAVRVFPNPTNGQVFIEAEIPGAVRLQVFDAAGRLVLSEEKSGLPCSLDLADLAEGMYLLKMEAGQRIERVKLTIAR